jgi:hypothetical protein
VEDLWRNIDQPAEAEHPAVELEPETAQETEAESSAKSPRSRKIRGNAVVGNIGGPYGLKAAIK